MKTTVDTLEVNVKYIRESIDRMERDIQKMQDTYATKVELAETKQEMMEYIAPLRRISSLIITTIIVTLIGAFFYLLAIHPYSLSFK